MTTGRQWALPSWLTAVLDNRFLLWVCGVLVLIDIDFAPHRHGAAHHPVYSVVVAVAEFYLVVATTRWAQRRSAGAPGLPLFLVAVLVVGDLILGEPVYSYVVVLLAGMLGLAYLYLDARRTRTD